MQQVTNEKLSRAIKSKLTNYTIYRAIRSKLTNLIYELGDQVYHKCNDSIQWMGLRIIVGKKKTNRCQENMEDKT